MNTNRQAEFDATERAAFDKWCEEHPNNIAGFFESITAEARAAVARDSSGRFVSQTAPTAEEVATRATAAAEPKEFKQVVSIGGTDFEFIGSSAANLELQINSAKSVHEQLAAARAENVVTTAATVEADAAARILLDTDFRLGNVTIEEYLRKTGAIERILAERGLPVDELSGERFTQSWADAGSAFQKTAEGADWVGGSKNMELIALQVTAMGLENSADKVGALKAAYAEMKRKGTYFPEGDVTQEQIQKLVDAATPQEIIQAWKDQQEQPGGSTAEANAAFIESHRNRGNTFFGK